MRLEGILRVIKGIKGKYLNGRRLERSRHLSACYDLKIHEIISFLLTYSHQSLAEISLASLELLISQDMKHSEC